VPKVKKLGEKKKKVGKSHVFKKRGKTRERGDRSKKLLLKGQ